MIKVLFFGQLVDIIGVSDMSLSDISDTDSLCNGLIRDFPNLADKHFLVAVNKKTILVNTLLQSGDEVAIMPPFSGG